MNLCVLCALCVFAVRFLEFFVLVFGQRLAVGGDGGYHVGWGDAQHDGCRAAGHSRPDLGVNLVGKLGVGSHVVFGVLLALAQALVAVGVERAELLDDRLGNLDQQDTAEPYYGIAQVAVLSSLSEGSPNALLEAMAGGEKPSQEPFKIKKVPDLTCLSQLFGTVPGSRHGAGGSERRDRSSRLQGPRSLSLRGNVLARLLWPTRRESIGHVDRFHTRSLGWIGTFGRNKVSVDPLILWVQAKRFFEFCPGQIQIASAN